MKNRYYTMYVIISLSILGSNSTIQAADEYNEALGKLYRSTEWYCNKNKHLFPSPLYYIALYKSHELFDYAAKKCPNVNSLLQKKNSLGFTIAHYAAQSQCTQTIKKVFSACEKKDIIKLLKIKDPSGLTCFDTIATCYFPSINKPQLACLLDSYKLAGSLPNQKKEVCSILKTMQSKYKKNWNGQISDEIEKVKNEIMQTKK